MSTPAQAAAQKVATEKPATPVPDTYVPPGGQSQTVVTGESWAGLALINGMDPWALIEYNFPGMGVARGIDPQLATKMVNWYLAEYVGCQTSFDGGKNYAFTSSLKGGRGVHQGGKIFLPPKTKTPTPILPPAASCAPMDISIPSALLTPILSSALLLARANLPTRVRCLASDEMGYVLGVYGNCLAYDDIYISDGIGYDGRPYTIALPLDGGWKVFLNLGHDAFKKTLYSKSTLVHELAHAWQSQHHPQPWQFILNCAKSQAAAGAATALGAANSIKSVGGVSVPKGTVTSLLGLGPVANALPTADADAYSYVPGQPFGNYGGEQIAQQVEDLFFPPNNLTPSARTQLGPILTHMLMYPPGAASPENIRGLSVIHYASEDEPGVVWHPA